MEFNRVYFVMTGDEAVKRNTVLHEIAHAIQHERQGYSEHDAAWRAICAEIGCDGKRLNKNAVMPSRKALANYGNGVSVEFD